MAKCNVTGAIEGPTGAAMADGRVIFRRRRVLQGIAGITVAGFEVEAVTSAQGEIDIDLYPGNYKVLAVAAGVKLEGFVSVPNLPAADFSTILDATDHPFANLVLLDDIGQLPDPQKPGVVYGVRVQP